MIQFIDDEGGYRAWLAANPGGFVVNSHRRPKATYLVLHLATCQSISPLANDNFTNHDYIKTCAASVEELRQWARGAAGGDLHSCGQCSPTGR